MKKPAKGLGGKGSSLKSNVSKALGRKPPSGSSKGEKRNDLNTLLVSIRSYFQNSSKNPRQDWQKIRQFVEKGLGGGRTQTRPRASKAEVRMPKFKEELMQESRTVSTANDTIPLTTTPSLYQLLSAVLDNPDAWLSMPSAQFGGRRPADLIGTEEEQKIIDLLLAVDQGLF